MSRPRSETFHVLYHEVGIRATRMSPSQHGSTSVDLVHVYCYVIHDQ
jgi:hypothetical protein